MWNSGGPTTVIALQAQPQPWPEWHARDGRRHARFWGDITQPWRLAVGRLRAWHCPPRKDFGELSPFYSMSDLSRDPTWTLPAACWIRPFAMSDVQQELLAGHRVVPVMKRGGLYPWSMGQDCGVVSSTTSSYLKSAPRIDTQVFRKILVCEEASCLPRRKPVVFE